MLNTYPTEKFVFHGTGREYFKIWIVNLLLTVATLGIYAAWAKVRTAKYFYQSTELNGNRFDYHGDPKAILKGNLMVAGIALIYIITSFTSEAVAGLIVLGMMCLMPLFMVMSLRFHLANTSYRGLRFHFNGTAKKAYGKLALAILTGIACVFVLGMLYGTANGLVTLTQFTATTGAVMLAGVVLTVASAALIFAMFICGLRLFIINHSAFGDAALNCTAPVGDFGKAVLKSTLLAAVAFWVLAIAAFFIHVSVFGASKISAFGSIVLLAYLVFFAFGAYLKTAISNLLWNNTTLGNQHEFISTARPTTAAWIHVSNIVLMVFTMGLFLPFARIRSMRYRIEHMTFVPVGSVDSIVRASQEKQRAFGDSVGDALGMELAL